jgi:hypothetical protein
LAELSHRRETSAGAAVVRAHDEQEDAMNAPTTFRLYRVGPDTVAATGPEDAIDVVVEHSGVSREDEDYDEPILVKGDVVVSVDPPFHFIVAEGIRSDLRLPDGAHVSLNTEQDARITGCVLRVRAPAQAWADLGRRFVGSTEY